MRITFVDEGVFPIHSVKLIWQDPYTPAVSMQNIKSDWIAEFDDPLPGSHGYRFMINNLFTINDPTANIYQPDENGKLWSMLVVGNNSHRLYNNEQYEVNINSVNISNDYFEVDSQEQEMFIANTDKQAVIRYGFTNVSGVHTSTALWLSPQGKVSEWAENYIIPTDNRCEYCWFGLNISEVGEEYSGDWSVMLLIDGKYILSNSFVIKREVKKIINCYNLCV